MYIASNGLKTAVILQDTMAESPREPGYQTNITNMVCWHSRYNLGDKHDYREPRDFAVDMVVKYLKPHDVFRAMANGELADFRLIDNEDNGDCFVESRIAFGPGKGTWERLDWKVSREFEVVEAEDASFDLEMDVLDNCWPDEMLRMCEKYGDVAIQPLYLYDHSGISMSTSSFVGRAQHAEWDSGQVGYIYLDKETAMRELVMPTDAVRLAMPLEGYKAVRLVANYSDFDSTMYANGYTPVRLDDLVESEVLESSEGQQVAEQAVKGALYKKDNKLFVLDKTKYTEEKDCDGTLRLTSYDIKPIFSYNAGYQPLTEENWRARAEQVLEADVVEYDNYLTGEVYGYQCYEGLVEVDSCWGFNPGKCDIEDLMNEELRGWFGADMDFDYESGDEFDIEEYFENNEFPELWKKVEKDVKDFIVFEGETSKVYPFAMSAEDLLANTGDVLESIVEEIYNQHEEYDTECIFAAIEAHAGISREAQPKLRAEDLEAGRDYTVDELVELARSKAQRPVGEERVQSRNNEIEM